MSDPSLARRLPDHREALRYVRGCARLTPNEWVYVLTGPELDLQCAWRTKGEEGKEHELAVSRKDRMPSDEDAATLFHALKGFVYEQASYRKIPERNTVIVTLIEPQEELL